MSKITISVESAIAEHIVIKKSTTGLILRTGRRVAKTPSKPAVDCAANLKRGRMQ